MADTGPNSATQAERQRKRGPADPGRAIERASAILARHFTAGHYNPGDTLPTRTELMERFGLTEYTVRGALKALNERGVIVTVRGGRSTLNEAKAAHILTRDADDPTRHLTPSAPPRNTRSEASTVTAELFDIRDREPLYISAQPSEYRTTGAPVLFTRAIPVEVLFIDPTPDPYGNRVELIKALTGHYGTLEVTERHRVILKPTAEIRTDLDLKPGAPVIEHLRLTRATTGRLLMAETEIIDATSATWEYKL